MTTPTSTRTAYDLIVDEWDAMMTAAVKLSGVARRKALAAVDRFLADNGWTNEAWHQAVEDEIGG